MKKDKSKTVFLEELTKTPIIEIACKKAGVARSTVYRWKNEDAEFAKAFDDALIEGRRLVNDVAISQLLSAIKNGDMRAITFWLKHFDENFKTKVEISGTVRQVRDELTEEEMALLTKALRLAGFPTQSINQQDNINFKDYEHREPELPDRSDQTQPTAKA